MAAAHPLGALRGHFYDLQAAVAAGSPYPWRVGPQTSPCGLSPPVPTGAFRPVVRLVRGDLLDMKFNDLKRFSEPIIIFMDNKNLLLLTGTSCG